MNQNSPLETTPDAPRPTGGQLGPRPAKSTSSGTSVSPPTAAGLLNGAVESAHDAVDRVADSGAPAARQLGEGIWSTADKPHAMAAPLREVRGDWAADARSKVRSSPLASVAVAFALGAVIYRLSY